jgi:hypothetical protein
MQIVFEVIQFLVLFSYAENWLSEQHYATTSWNEL